MTSHPSLAPSRSLSRHLWSWSVALLALAWVALVAMSYYTGLHEADEITDGQLVSAAALALDLAAADERSVAVPGVAGRGTRSGALRRDAGGHDAIPPGDVSGYVQQIMLMVWRGETLIHDSHGLADRLPRDDRTGFSTMQARDGGHRWRRYLVHDAGADRRVAVLIDLDERKELGRDIAEHIARPAFLVLPLAALLSWWTIRRGLRPLRRLSRQIQALDQGSGARLSAERRFVEIDITVDAINGLVERIAAQTEREREFASDVAHELRSPLAAITLQAQTAARAATTPAERACALSELQQASHRAAHVLTQLLDLARARRVDMPPQPVDLAALAAQVLAAYGQRSVDSGHELELVAPTLGAIVQGNPLMLELALRNLVDNALQHTPAGTRVLVSVTHSDAGVVLAVRDDARAVASSGQAVNVPGGSAGLGIGLRLVARIADWHQARFDRSAPPPPWQTQFALCWPAAGGSEGVRT